MASLMKMAAENTSAPRHAGETDRRRRSTISGHLVSMTATGLDQQDTKYKYTSSYSYACDFCGALHLENEVGGVVSPTYIIHVVLQKRRRMSDRQSEELESQSILVVGLVCLDIISHCDR